MAALMYNGVNSTIDALRGKHDSIGSVAAGALTGAAFKSTGGVPFSPSKSCCSILICNFSRDQTHGRCCNSGIKLGRNLELCETECLMTTLLVLFTTLISILNPPLHFGRSVRILSTRFRTMLRVFRGR